MATKPPDKASRDANLDALKEAVDEWATVALTRLDNEAKFIRSVLDGRGANTAGTKNLEEASALLQADIDAFLVNN